MHAGHVPARCGRCSPPPPCMASPRPVVARKSGSNKKGRMPKPKTAAAPQAAWSFQREQDLKALLDDIPGRHEEVIDSRPQRPCHCRLHYMVAPAVASKHLLREVFQGADLRKAEKPVYSCSIAARVGVGGGAAGRWKTSGDPNLGKLVRGKVESVGRPIGNGRPPLVRAMPLCHTQTRSHAWL